MTYTEAPDPGDPIPARLLAPWIEDNGRFIQGLSTRDARLDQLPKKRDELLAAGMIDKAKDAHPVPLGAVDAAVSQVALVDQISILIQVVHVKDDGGAILGKPLRVTGVSGHELSLCVTPMRMAQECRALSEATNPTIADTSFWTMLMEFNSALSKFDNISIPEFKRSVDSLVSDGCFLRMLRNTNVVPMSKISQSDKVLKGISDRESYTRILKPGEFRLPQRLQDGTTGNFGVSKDLSSSNRGDILDIFNNKLGVIFFRPHAWSRAYRIEGHIRLLSDENWLMPLLASISRHTTTQTIVEPWPQYMADFTASRMKKVADMYGELNRYRFGNLTPNRTPR